MKYPTISKLSKKDKLTLDLVLENGSLDISYGRLDLSVMDENTWLISYGMGAVESFDDELDIDDQIALEKELRTIVENNDWEIFD